MTYDQSLTEFEALQSTTFELIRFKYNCLHVNDIICSKTYINGTLAFDSAIVLKEELRILESMGELLLAELVMCGNTPGVENGFRSAATTLLLKLDVLPPKGLPNDWTGNWLPNAPANVGVRQYANMHIYSSHSRLRVTI